MTHQPEGDGSLRAAVARMEECRRGLAIGEPFYADADAWDVIRTNIFRGAEADRRDAERYRWLRDNAGAGFYMTLESRRESSEWDSEIDAAIAATKEQT